MILAILLIIAGIAVIIGACVATLIDAGIVSLPVGIFSGAGMVIMGFIMLAGTLLVNQQQSQYQAAYQQYAAQRASYDSLLARADREINQLGESRIILLTELLTATAAPTAGQSNNLDADAVRRINGTYQAAHRALVAYQIVKSPAMQGSDGAFAERALARGTATATGAAAQIGAYGITQTFGTAGTGAAIGGLSGAAQHSATMAALGGGTMAGGTLALAGIAVIPVVIASASYEGWRYFKIRRQVRDAITEMETDIAAMAAQRSDIVSVIINAETQTKRVELAITALDEAAMETGARPNLELIRRATEALEQPISNRGNSSP